MTDSDQLYSYDYKEKQEEPEGELTRPTVTETSTDLKAASLRVKILLIIFNVICFIAFAIYVSFIALMIKFQGFAWIFVLDIIVCLFLLITMIFGVISVTTCVLPTVRFAISIIYFICIVVTGITAVVARIIIPSSLNFNPQSVGDQASAISMVIIIAIFLLVFAIPCCICSGFQIAFAFGLFREMKEIPPGFAVDAVVKAYMKVFSTLESFLCVYCRKKE